LQIKKSSYVCNEETNKLLLTSYLDKLKTNKMTTKVNTKAAKVNVKKVNVSDDELLGLDLSNLDSILEKANELNVKTTNANSQKGLYKFVFAVEKEDLVFVNAQKHVKSLNFEKRNTSGQRSKFRKHLEQMINAYNNANDSDKQVLIVGFLKYYKDCYLINDFTPESLCNISSKMYSSIDTFLKEVKNFKIKDADIQQIFKKIA